MKVKRYNYRHQIGDELEAVVADIGRMIVEGRYILTGEVRRFETAFAQYLGARHVRGVNTGTDALIVAMQTVGVGPGDEVITQANTFHATVAAIRLVGAMPVLVDADEESFLMDIDQLESAITDRTRAVIPVHLFGKPTPMEPIQDLAAKYGFHVIEDAAQSHGARWKGQRVGTFGALSCFSFHPSKNLAAAGDGGAVATSDDKWEEELNCRRQLGQKGQNHHVRVGLNSKLDAIQARVLSAKLGRLDEWNKGRRTAASWYRERLEDLPISFQSRSSDEEHVYHLFQIRTSRRDDLADALKSSEIDVVVRYPTPIHLQPAFAGMGWKAGQFPVSEALARELLCLPIRPDLSIDEVDFVTENVAEFFRNARSPS